MPINQEPGDNVIYVNFSNAKDTFTLKYRIYKNSVAEKWFKMMKKTQLLNPSIIDNGIFFGNGVMDKQKVAADLIHNVEYHNDYCKRTNLEDCSIPVTLDNPVTQQRLNLLHEYFEKYAEDPRFTIDAKAGENLQFLNLNIHRLESCLYGAESSHIEVLQHPRMCQELEDQDYLSFTPNFKWGELYLTYGMTGVPTMNAFHMKSDPTPQNVVTNGMMMAFWGDITFQQVDELKDFLKTKDMDINNPRIALGYIPLGILENIEDANRAQILEQIKTHAFVKNVIAETEPYIKREVTKPVSTASWPYDQEIYYHLDLVPYIDLNVKFDAKKLYAEAERALGYFVSHRDYDQESKQTSGKWKSLALRGLFGDYTKTQYHTSYEFKGDPVYKNTVFAELCPETMKFLETVTDVSKCERIRYMLLEPGASVKTHRDNQDMDTCLAVNISLNMPQGCVFHAQVNPDGTENPFSVKLPFKDSGSVLLFNNAKYHKVVNNSDIPRIHIIFHGPIKVSDEQLIKLARTQNNVFDRQELIRKVMYKKNWMGEELDKTPSLFGDWQMTGLRENSIPDNYAFAIYDHDRYAEADKGSCFYLQKRTNPTIFPLKYDLIKENEWDKYLKDSFRAGKEFAIIAAAGTFFLNLHQFIKHVVRGCVELRKKGWPAAGHLMDFNDGKFLPYFHEQFLIVNLKVWNDLGQPLLGPLYGTEAGALENALISSETVHDNYTPLFIRAQEAGHAGQTRTGNLAWGSALIKKAVLSGKGVLNLSSDLRKEKQYAYPRDELKAPKDEIEKMISHRLNHSKNEVFYFNNEPLTVFKLADLNPNKFISVSAGMKPFQIIKQFGISEKCEITFADFSPNALAYMKQVVKASDFSDLVNTIRSVVKKDAIKHGDADKVESNLNGIVMTYFNNSKDELMKAVKAARNARFLETNLVQDPSGAASILKPGDRFVIWISNAFYNNSLYLLLTPDEAEQALVALAKSIATKTGLKAFKRTGTHTILFGESLAQPSGLLTDGALTEDKLQGPEWKEL